MPEREPWDRRQGETTKAYEAFRQFKDVGPLRALASTSASPGSVERWSSQFDWRARATAWDDRCARVADQARLEAIRAMHDTHYRAGRAVTQLALRALQQLQPGEMAAGEVVRLLEMGARLERDALLADAEPVWAAPAVADEDPWERIARELSGS